jgi:hypothetical protein
MTFTDDLLYAIGALVAEGETIWDIGANMGVFSVAAVARAKTGNVMAFEPAPGSPGCFAGLSHLRKTRGFG